MKGMVDELVAIVGSSSKAQKADSRSGHHAKQSAQPHKALASAINKFKSKAGSANGLNRLPKRRSHWTTTTSSSRIFKLP